MTARLFPDFLGPVRRVLEVTYAPLSTVDLRLECGHTERRERRARGYAWSRCAICAIPATRTRMPVRVSWPVVRWAIRPDVHERFLAVRRRVDKQMRGNGRAGAPRMRVATIAWTRQSLAVSIEDLE